MDLEVADVSPSLRPALKKRLETYKSELAGAESKLRRNAAAVGSRFVASILFYLFIYS